MRTIGRIGAAVFCGLLVAGFAMAHDNSPARHIIIPEAIWSPAAGGGTWLTEIQVTSFTPSTTVQIYFIGNGFMRGPLNLVGLEENRSVYYPNILSTLNTLEGGAFAYYGKVGALWIRTTSNAQRIHVQARTRNGDFGKTLQGQAFQDPAVGSGIIASNHVQFSPLQRGVIQNMTNNATYRTFAGFFNTNDVNPITIQFVLFSSTGTIIGSAFTKTIAPMGYITFNPFDEAGRPYPTYSNINCYLYINPTSGTGHVMGFGSSANNYTNDTYAHVMVQFQ